MTRRLPNFGDGNINWNVTVNGKTKDLRELILIGSDEDVSEEDILREFLEKNSNLLKWKDVAKLSSFKQAVQELKVLVDELKDAFTAMDNKTLLSRNEHAFALDPNDNKILGADPGDVELDPEAVVILEAVANILDSLINAFSNRTASLIYFYNNKTDVKPVEYEGEYFKAYVFDYYKVTLSPSNNQEITIYDLVNGDKSLRDLLLYLCEDRPFYDNKTEVLWKEDVYDLSELD